MARPSMNIGAFSMRKSIISLVLALGLAAPAFSDTLTLRSDAPARYVVVKGDTLWGISGRYLKKPWNWPRLWQMNRDEVKNPHLIYPGDVLVLTWVNGQPRLGLERNRREVKLSPQVRIEDQDRALPSIPAKAIEPFLSRPLIVDIDSFSRAPRLVAGSDEHVAMSSGDRAYAMGLDQGGSWQSYRPNKPLRDPDSGETLGYEVTYGGDLAVEKMGDEVQSLRVRKVAEEILVGDRLVKAPRDYFVSYVPHPPEKMVQGKIISTPNGVAGAAQYYNVAINLGQRDGLETGHVLDILKNGSLVKVTTPDNRATKVLLPTEKAGSLFVYRVFNRVAYGLVMESAVPIGVGDVVRTPDEE